MHANSAALRHNVIDATCPLVTKVHVQARRYADDGYTVILIGHAGHEEVVGTMGEAPEATILVQDVAEAEALDLPADTRVAYITQTTLSVDETSEIIAVLRRRFPQVYAPRKEDICYATSNRQWAVKEMLAEIDLLLVLGSKNSSNSNRLVDVARASGVAGHLIDDETEIDERWLDGVRTVGISSGRLGAGAARRRGSATGSATRGVERIEPFQMVAEDVTFKLPVELRRELTSPRPSAERRCPRARRRDPGDRRPADARPLPRGDRGGRRRARRGRRRRRAARRRAGGGAQRGRRARRARDVVVFVDSDVARPSRTRSPGSARAFASDDELVGDLRLVRRPRSRRRGTVAAFRNLLHHVVHQRSAGRRAARSGPVSARCGATAFDAAGGFDADRYPHPSIEDIELGGRLAAAGADPSSTRRIQGTHLKEWTLASMVQTDFRRRGVPWVDAARRAARDAGDAQPRRARARERGRGARVACGRRAPAASRSPLRARRRGAAQPRPLRAPARAARRPRGDRRASACTPCTSSTAVAARARPGSLAPQARYDDR